MNAVQLERLLHGLRQLDGEKEWVEFKENNESPDMIGETISALSNSARLRREPYAYMVWGIEDGSHQIVGTSFRPSVAKKGNEELEHWLVRMLTPSLDLQFYEVDESGSHVVILEIPAALHTPVQFAGAEYIRVGSLKKPLKSYPEKERELWQILNVSRFEQGIATAGVDADEVLRLLDYPKYFELIDHPLPSNKDGILSRLLSDGLIVSGLQGWSVTNLGAILFAKNLNDFGSLSRKGLRVIQYSGRNRISTLREAPGNKGYAVGFEGAIGYINALLPESEQIGQALRRGVRTYPELAIRELVANALIHQDFTLTGTGPMVEVFDDRIEITNPGRPLVDTLRMMDEPPRSRNESLAALMRRMNICEERGSGIDKVVSEVEAYQLPAPSFNLKEQAMVVVLYAHRALKDMSKDDRTRACYQHACLRYVSNDVLTNPSLRTRFEISEGNSAQASRIIAETVEAGLVKPANPDNKSRKLMQYHPFWA
ncbi:ATP-binding protein [Pseudomonas syringae group sp. J309-1]|uniref:ATP-binding protein n=1 Tax=Pseudomonas syringae group sp. J309-1 TaxID=3079588 RepID=UPI002911E231|nr:ATP-binding protein [Pseudomonas syringae group sp. J309-1]MDU8357839.1 ATP-binding protein [Pseudomonas syringae group sp. J309-1]